MARTANGGTRVEQTYRQLRADILSGRLRPGEQLKLNLLAAKYGVSVSVMREAVTRVAERRLARSSPGYGFAVMEGSPEDIRDLTSTRIDVEGLALRRSVELGDLAWEARVLAVHHELSRTAQRDPAAEVLSDDWAMLHRRFHHTLLEACGSVRLLDFCRNLFDAAELYRAWAGTKYTSRPVAQEHDLIVKAVVDRDVEVAVVRLGQHIERTADWLLEHIDEILGDVDERRTSVPTGVREQRGTSGEGFH